MEDQQSSGHCGSSQHHEHSIGVSSHRGSVHLPETSISASNSSAASSHQQLHFASRMGERQATLAEKEDSLSPAVPSLLHLPLCRQTNPVPGLRYRNLGKSGLRVSNVGLGTWVTFSAPISEEVAEDIIVMAFESGINVFDLSDGYCGPRAEVSLGRILRQRRWRRSSYIVITKIYWSYRSEERGLSRKHIIESIRASLDRLQLDYIDVVLIHRADPMCPMEEVVRAMNHVIDHGWIMYWGTSRWSSVEISEAYNNCRQFNCPLPICEQSEYHFLCREKIEISLPEVYNKLGVGLMTWSPLTMGFSASKGEETFPNFHRMSFKKKFSTVTWPDDEAAAATKENAYVPRMSAEEVQRQNGKLREISLMAERFGCTSSQLAIAWTLKNEHVHSVLIGAISPEQLYEHLQALQIVPKLSAAVMLDLERVLDNKPIRPPMISTLAMR
ncbi:voltage-gated potassium channel subunit beta-2-like isoform X3 [Daphnia pulicaria]|nr:voltage-gated potassium channel subunit beta-2-like isoform X3 [Daphnia pulicaria]XP_046653851.1 voltage-gated potassium channel subunit beta-2-like isoform X3 [Daphnia pulicaria]XP_046653852.1 voltage-gated potassium channel subunit beta-2-like isoform X3 [Daphnia pulicaria]